MPKRFTATEKWTDPWFCSLTDNNKLFWLFLLDNCNHAGIWRVNWFVFGCYVKGFEYDPKPYIDRIFELSKEKWFIPKFVEFQYGVLNPNNNAHRSVISLLEKEGANKPLTSPCLGAMDMVKDMDKAKVKVIGELHKDKDIIIIPDWVDKEAWKDFSDMRIKMRKPMTKVAIRLTIEALKKLKSQGQNPKDILNQSIQRSWQGVFPLREDWQKTKSTGCTPIPGKYDGIGDKA